MALLFMDSFDHYATADILEKYAASSGTLAIGATGRRGSGGLRKTTADGGVTSPALPVTGSTAIVGVALQMPSYPDRAPLFSIRTGGTPQVTVGITTGGQLTVYRGPDPWAGGSVLLGTTTAVVGTGAFAYLELQALLHASAGTITLRLNGVTVLSLTGQNTANSGTAWDAVTLGRSGNGQSHTLDHDDLYVLDGSGSAPWNAFLGDVRVDVRNPTGAGALAQWTPSAGSNWQNVDDATPNDDTDHNAAASSGLTDTFVCQDAPVPGATLYGVQINLSAKKSDAGTCTLKTVVRQSGANQLGADLSPGTSYAYLRQIHQVNPHTSAQWTEAEFNADEFGYTRTA